MPRNIWKDGLFRQELDETRWYDHILIYLLFFIGGFVAFDLLMFYLGTRSPRYGGYRPERFDFYTSPLVLIGGGIAAGATCVISLIIHQVHDRKVEAEKARIRALKQQIREQQKSKLFSHLDK